MTSTQYRAALKKLRLNLRSGADFLGISYRTSRRHASLEDRERVPRLVAMALRIAIRYKMTPEMMIEEFGD